MGEQNLHCVRVVDAKVPLRGRMGTAWDVANAALLAAAAPQLRG